MEILLAGLSVLVKNWGIVLGIVSFWLLGAGIIFLIFKILPGSNLSLAEYLSVSLGGGLLPLFWGLFPAFGLNLALKAPLLALLLPLLVTLGVLLALIPAEDDTPIPGGRPFLALLGFLAVSLPLRLTFISSLILPPYFDSAAHYDLIRGLMDSFQAANLPHIDALNGEYYHLGFHALSAALGVTLQATPQEIMLVFGQILLTILPLPLFFIVRQATGQTAPGLFAVLLAGWGWDMPAHALNWGKYPALFSLLTLEFVVCAALLLRPPNASTRADRLKSTLLLLLCALGLAAATLIHTRALVLAFIFVIAWLLALGWNHLPSPARMLTFALTLGVLLALVLTLRTKPSLTLVFDPYLGSGWRITLIIALLLPLALKTFPRAAFAGLLALVISLGSLFIPVFLPSADYQTLLDRPFVEMSLCLPLTLLGGLGYAGLRQTFQGSALLQRVPQKLAWGLVTCLLFGVVFARLGTYPFAPSACCQVFKDTDAVAFDWMGRNLPVDATVLIAATPLYVLEASPTTKFAGSDAGVWIKPLLARKTLALAATTNFGAPSVRKKLCQRGVTHIYLSTSGQSFAPALLQDKPAWYARLFFLPQAQVYQVICP